MATSRTPLPSRLYLLCGHHELVGVTFRVLLAAAPAFALPAFTTYQLPRPHAVISFQLYTGAPNMLIQRTPHLPPYRTYCLLGTYRAGRGVLKHAGRGGALLTARSSILQAAAWLTLNTHTANIVSPSTGRRQRTTLRPAPKRCLRHVAVVRGRHFRWHIADYTGPAPFYGIVPTTPSWTST